MGWGARAGDLRDLLLSSCHRGSLEGGVLVDWIVQPFFHENILKNIFTQDIYVCI